MRRLLTTWSLSSPGTQTVRVQTACHLLFCGPLQPSADANVALSLSLSLFRITAGDFFSGPDTSTASVRDVYAKRNLGNFTDTFNMTVPPMDALLLKFAFH